MEQLEVTYKQRRILNLTKKKHLDKLLYFIIKNQQKINTYDFSINEF